MKKLSLLLVVLLLLSGCSTFSKNDKVDQQGARPVNKAVDEKTFVKESEYVKGLSSNTDVTKCDEITDSNLKAICVQNAIYSLAVESKNPKKCKSIVSTQAQVACELDAEAAANLE